MSEVLVLEFKDVTVDQYQSVNSALGIDVAAGTGDWPHGLEHHTGAAEPDGGFMVFEVWDSQSSAQEFMETRLGAALHKAGIPEPTRAEWMTLAGHHDS